MDKDIQLPPDITSLVATGDLESLKEVLVHAQPCINVPVDSEGTTLLHIAANSTSEMVQYLLDNGADAYCQTQDGLTALHIAAMWGKKRVIEVLLKYGVESQVFDSDGMLATDYACEEGHMDCVELLQGQINQPLNSHNLSCAETFVAMALVEETSKDLCTTAPGSFDTSIMNTQESNVYKDRSNQILPQDILDLTDSLLRQRLISLGEEPGPINEVTRGLYKTYLYKLESKAYPCDLAMKKYDKAYQYELALVLKGISSVPTAECWDDEVQSAFLLEPVNLLGIPSKSKQSYSPVRDSFNYILIDPQGLNMFLDESSSEVVQFKCFVGAIFYIGKGKNSRPIQHLKEAKMAIKEGKKLNSKLEKISSIWCSQRGVVSLPLYHNSRQGEAFSRECCMIDAIGLNNLTNKVNGHMHGSLAQWSLTRRRQFGVYLLYKGYQIMKIALPPELKIEDL